MHADELYSDGPDLAGTQRTSLPSRQVARGAGQHVGQHVVREEADSPPGRRWWAAAAWIAGALALFAILVRISYSSPVNSDAANNTLQAWDLLHGNLLLHGWIIGDATYYTFELPLYAITESVLGLHSVVPHVDSAIIYVIIAALAVAIAKTSSRGLAAWTRGGVVVTVLAAALLTPQGVSIVLEKPDHTGTSAIFLLCFLLIDRFPSRRFTAPLILLILCAGQLGDETVLYVGVPTVILVCVYRTLAARTLRTADMAIAIAAAVSAPLAVLVRSVIVHFGGYLMIAPRNGLALFSQWGYNATLTQRGIRALFGAFAPRGAPLATAGAVLGFICLAAAAYGFCRVVWNWRRASRAEQLLCLLIVVNIGAYVFSTLPVPSNARELVAVLPCGAILAARALVPDRIVASARAQVAIAASALIAIVPLAAAATVPPATPEAVPLAAWLEAHGLKYGVAGYWNASAVTLVSDDRVQVRAVTQRYFGMAAKDWETKVYWYDSAQHDATFAIADITKTTANDGIPAYVFEQYFGRPSSVHEVAGKLILIYRKNLLKQVTPALPLPGDGKKSHKHHHR